VVPIIQEVGWMPGPMLTLCRKRNSLVTVRNRTQVVCLSSMWPVVVTPPTVYFISILLFLFLAGDGRHRHVVRLTTGP